MCTCITHTHIQGRLSSTQNNKINFIKSKTFISRKKKGYHVALLNQKNYASFHFEISCHSCPFGLVGFDTPHQILSSCFPFQEVIPLEIMFLFIAQYFWLSKYLQKLFVALSKIHYLNISYFITTGKIYLEWIRMTGRKFDIIILKQTCSISLALKF